MRKHFLILMLLTLLPLAGWAQTATLGEVGVGKYTYGDDALPVPVVKDSEGAILEVKTHYTVDANAYDKTTNKVVNKQDMKGGQELYLKIMGAGAYIGQEKKAYFTVQKKVLNITVATFFQRNYLGTVEPVIEAAHVAAGAGELEDAAPFNDTYAELGTLTYTYAGYGKPEYNGGKYDITFSGLSSDCYEIKYPKMKFTIVGTDLSGETVTVKAGTAFANKTYKGANYVPADLTGLKLTWGTKELVQGTDFTIAAGSGDWKNVGSPYYTVNFKGNYSGTIPDFGTFTIDQAPVSVTCEDYEINYDAVDHKTTEYAGAVTFTWMGLVGADVADYAAVTGTFKKPDKVQVGSTAINAGEYALKIENGAAAGNYYLAGRLDGKLIIKKVDLTVKAKDASKSIGADDPAFELDAPVGLQGKDEINTDAKITFTRVAGTAAGSYDITPDVNTIKIKNASAPKDRTSNYNIKLADPKGTLTIGKTPITVTFKNASKFYGQVDPTFDENSYVVDGLDKGDALPAFTITRENAGKPAGEVVGYYAISATIANPNPEKYTSVTVVPGALQIKKAQLTFTMPAQNLAKGKKASDLSKATIKVDGINNSDVAAELYNLSFNGVSVDGEGKTDVDQTIADGIYATLTAAAQACYEVTGANKVDATKASGKIIVGDGTTFALAFTTAADAADYNLIKGHAGEVQDVTITLNNRVDREVPTGTAHPWAAVTWNTMVLPFEVTVAELSYQLGYAIVNVVDPSKTTEGNVQFKLEMGKIPANTPFCVKTDANIADGKVLTFSKRLIVDAGKYPSVDAGNGYKFVGAYQNFTIDKNNPTYNFLRGDNNKWAHIGASSANNWTVVPFDAYVDLSAASAPEAVTFTFEEIDGSTTAIKNVDASVNDVKAVKAGWYTIDGKKLNAAPAQKGIYIYNGKKYVVK